MPKELLPRVNSTSIRVLFAAIFVITTSAHAQVLRDYRCSIQSIVSASTKFENIRRSQEKLYLGKQFTVDRRTGVMAGALKNAYVTNPVVIDIGSSENAFKAVTTMRRDQGAGAGSNIYALTISEFEGTAKKPFIFLDNDIAYLGHCEHF